ncbi:MAG: hypothetical protein FJ309_05910 [Planctomycetes bacterium]|nr:hypothetical protein [Planctomycetota bacterium]
MALAMALVVITSAWAAPPGSRGAGRRLFEAFARKPEDTPPQRFIPAPTPPPLPADVSPAASRPSQPPPPPPVPPLPTTWDEARTLLTGLQESALRVAIAAVDPDAAAARPTVVAKPFAPAARPPTPPGSSSAAAPRFNPAGTAAAPPATQRMARLRGRIAETLATYQRRPLNTAVHTPWEVMHGFIAFGIPTKVRVGGPGGDLVNAIGWMNMGGRCRGQVMLGTDGERLVAMRGIGVQGHAAQYLAILAQCRVALNSPINLQTRSFTVADLVAEEQQACRSGTELTFTLIGLAHYLPSDATWVARDGSEWSLERLVAEEIEQPIRGAPCGGTHRLFGLSYACQRRLRAAGTLDGHYRRADRFVRDYQDFTLGKLQNRDGSFSTEWFKYPADREDDIDRKVQTTGHILEWLVGSVDQERLYEPRIVAATEFLATALLREPSRDWKIGPLGHALHALTIYQERAWGTVLPGGIAAYHGAMKATEPAATAADPARRPTVR